MNEVTITFNGQEYIAIYNVQTGYYEVNVIAPNVGGVYNAEIEFVDILGNSYVDVLPVQVLAQKAIKLDIDKVFMWIFSYVDFSVKDIVELPNNYKINIDEETNANSIIYVLKKTTAKSKDIVAVKKNNEIIYWGIIEEIQNEDGKQLYEYTIKYITNLFNRNIKLENAELIKTTGIEDFIGQTITNNYIANIDTFINLPWLQIEVITHTPKQTSVTNVENNIYNLHTWLTNCTQNYNVVYSFSIYNGNLLMKIEILTYAKELIDTNALPISNYTEVFETNIVSKVTVIYNKVNGEDSPR